MIQWLTNKWTCLRFDVYDLIIIRIIKSNFVYLSKATNFYHIVSRPFIFWLKNKFPWACIQVDIKQQRSSNKVLFWEFGKTKCVYVCISGWISRNFKSIHITFSSNQTYHFEPFVKFTKLPALNHNKDNNTGNFFGRIKKIWYIDMNLPCKLQ